MSTKLNPVTVRSAKAATTQAQQDGRKRAIVAINEDGKLVVCCRRTAKKNGWEVQEVLYGKAKPEVVPAPEPVKSDTMKVSRTKVKKVKDFVDTAVDDILGK